MPISPEMSLYVNCYGFQTVRIELYCNYILFGQGHKNKSLVLSSISRCCMFLHSWSRQASFSNGNKFAFSIKCWFKSISAR